MDAWIGTSGFQYPEWKGGFYPATLSAAKMLGFYADRFATTEINYSFRHIPSAKTVRRWSAETPERFTFSFKASQRITHFAKLRECAATLITFYRAISAMKGNRGPVLFQLPPTFPKDARLLDAFLRQAPRKMRAAWEFRHASWLDAEIFEILRKHNAALCLAESEALSTPVVATADFGYVRLRREDYSRRDITRWAATIQKQASQWREVFIYFKHEETGVGPKFAAQMLKALNPRSPSRRGI